MKYKSLGEQQEFQHNQFRLVPIRIQDRWDIMKWRNEQIYHLRQNKPLTPEDQDYYFNHIVSKLFDQEQPGQLLFSFLEGEICIGYGGLVHINWIDRNAEISFIMNTELESVHFEKYWVEYLSMIEQVAFDVLGFHKIYTYAFDLRPHLYKIFENSAYILDARLAKHCFFDNKFIDVVIHCKFNKDERN